MRISRLTSRTVQFTISALILIVLVRYVGPLAVAETMRDVDWRLLGISIALLPLAFLLRAMRWSAIIQKGGVNVRLWSLYRLSLVGVALNFIVPAGGGEIARSYYGYRETGLKEEMLSSSLADKLMALFSVFLLGISSALLVGFHQYAWISLAGLAVCGFFLFLPKYAPWGMVEALLKIVRVRDLSRERLEACFALSGRLIGLTLAISIIGWAITYLQFYLICLACSAQVSIVYAYALAPLIILARMFPFTFSGFGSQELVVIYTLGQVGVDSASAVSVSLLFSLVFLVIPGVFGAAAIWTGHERF